MRILSGSSNPQLAERIAKNLNTTLIDVQISKFPNGEKRIWVQEELADETVIIVQSFSEPVDEHIIELTLLADACKHLRVKKVIAVIPWLGYSPQDKVFRPGEPISIHVIARLIEAIGIDHIITADIHSQASLKLFNIPITEISSLPIYVNYFKNLDLADHVVVSVDKGSRERSQKLAQALDLPLALFNKTRHRKTGEITLEFVEGDIENKHIISFDDFVSTGSTRIGASKLLKKMGATSYTDCITHALLAGHSSAKLQNSHIDHLIATDTYPIPTHKHFQKLHVLTSSHLFAKTIKEISAE